MAKEQAKEYRVYKAPRDYINYSCIWIRDTVDRESGEIYKVERVLDKNHKKVCYVQIRDIDKSLENYINLKEIEESTDNVMLISEHYRKLLGIKKSEFQNRMMIKAIIKKPSWGLCKFIFMHRLASYHPEVATRLSLSLGYIGFLLGIISLIFGVLSFIIA